MICAPGSGSHCLLNLNELGLMSLRGGNNSWFPYVILMTRSITGPSVAMKQ